MLYERPMSDFFKQLDGEVTALDKLVQKVRCQFAPGEVNCLRAGKPTRSESNKRSAF